MTTNNLGRCGWREEQAKKHPSDVICVYEGSTVNKDLQYGCIFRKFYHFGFYDTQRVLTRYYIFI